MKISKLKNRVAAMLPLFTASAAKAYIYLIIGLTVLVVGGIIIYCIWDFCKTYLPTDQQSTNNVPNGIATNSSYLIKYDSGGTNSLYLGEAYGGLDPYTCIEVGMLAGSLPPLAMVEQQTLPSCCSPPFQYGLDVFCTPWVSANTNPAPLIMTQDIINNTNEYCVAVTVGNMTMFYDTTNVDSADTNGDTCCLVTNLPNTVLIERTTAFVSWVPIFTNSQMTAGTALSFVDSNAPPDHAFYRSAISGSTGN